MGMQEFTRVFKGIKGFTRAYKGVYRGVYRGLQKRECIYDVRGSIHVYGILTWSINPLFTMQEYMTNLVSKGREGCMENLMIDLQYAITMLLTGFQNWLSTVVWAFIFWRLSTGKPVEKALLQLTFATGALARTHTILSWMVSTLILCNGVTLWG